MNDEYVILVGSMMVMVEVSLHWGLGGLGKQRHGSGVNTYTGRSESAIPKALVLFYRKEEEEEEEEEEEAGSRRRVMPAINVCC